MCVSGNTNAGGSELTFIYFHLVSVVERKNNALASQSPSYKKPSRPVKIKRNGCKEFVAEKLLFSSPLCLLLSAHSADRLSVCSNQKFIQSCSGSLRLSTTMRSPPTIPVALFSRYDSCTQKS